MGKLPEETERAISDPALMQAWGELNAAWDCIEYALYALFNSMLLDDAPVTRAIFFSVQAHAAKRDMVKNVAARVLSKSQRARLARLMKRIEARAGERNELAHGDWWEEHSFNTGKVTVRRTPHMPNLWDGVDRGKTLHELREISRKMRETYAEVNEFIKPLAFKKMERDAKEEMQRHPEQAQAISQRLERLRASLGLPSA